jgi:hypothetical protein
LRKLLLLLFSLSFPLFAVCHAETGKLRLSSGKGELSFEALGRSQVVVELLNDTGKDLKLVSYSKP